jgi:hypothetical protein
MFDEEQLVALEQVTFSLETTKSLIDGSKSSNANQHQ